eukprot:4615884-Pleurochrysis_carterae.AAC.1
MHVGEGTRRSAGGRAKTSKAIGSSLESDIGQSNAGPQQDRAVRPIVGRRAQSNAPATRDGQRRSSAAVKARKRWARWSHPRAAKARARIGGMAPARPVKSDARAVAALAADWRLQAGRRPEHWEATSRAA